jgi:flagellar biosynthesis protein FlhA
MPIDISEKSPVLQAFSKNMDLVLVVGIVALLFVVFVPVPSVFIDFLLIISITASILTLLTSIYVKEPLEFSVFPSLLLVSTTYRLALSIATTRLILTKAGEKGAYAAGKVIYAFGDFVAGNEPIIGFIIFVIIIIIQFIVITKGSNRISEVAARFTLDAMPGKQMAIDADLNAGLIKEGEARLRRKQIERQADFYGAMDGATKFVRGDAIAGIIITIVNIIGGFIIGYLKYNMSLEEAIRVYTLLSIGDGLVSQVPALIVSISAGLIVTRAGSESNLGSDFLTQMFSSPRVLYIAAIFLAILIITPMPTFQLLLIGGSIFAIGYIVKTIRAKNVVRDAERREKDAPKKPERVEALLHVDPMELEIGYGLIRLVDSAQGGDLLNSIALIRRSLALELGIVVPPIRIRDNMQIQPNDYVLKLRGATIASGSLSPDQYLAMDSGMATGQLEGIKTKEPAFGLPATWVPEAQKQRAETMGYTVVDACTVLATHLTEVVRSHAADLLTREDVNNLLNTVKDTNPTLVQEVVPAMLKPGDVQKVLQNLLRENVSVRDLAAILETLGDYAPRTKDVEVLSEYVRNSLARTICQKYQEKDGKMYVVTLDPRLEDLIKGSIERTEMGSFITLAPKTLSGIVERLSKAVEQLITRGHHPVVLCSPQIRLHVKKIVDTVQPSVAVLSYNEVVRDVKVEALGMVSLDAA